jgi:hypothetical protein
MDDSVRPGHLELHRFEDFVDLRVSKRFDEKIMGYPVIEYELKEPSEVE